MDYSVIITAKDEPKTVAELITEIENQLSKISEKFEILVVCPDEKTKESAISRDKLQVVDWIKDKGKGKPAALNLAFDRAKGDILILTDGDVRLEKEALKKLIDGIEIDANNSGRIRERVFSTSARNKQRNIGLITGRPVPTNPRENLFGYWAHFLTTAADRLRRKRSKAGEYLDASGYLIAVRRVLVSSMPENILVDDAWLSRRVWNQGYKIGYAPEAEVKVKFPTNFSDWLTQKKRTTSGYVQLKSVGVPLVGTRVRAHRDAPLQNQMRGFFQESRGLRLALTYPENIKEYFWTFLLVLARLYVWLAVFWTRRVLRTPYSGNWKRIESTK